MTLKPYHHVRLDAEFKADCKIWVDFPTHDDMVKIVSHPMVDFNMFESSVKRPFLTDASAGPELGFGCIYRKNWTYSKWEKGFILKYKPSIEYLELYVLCVGVITWQEN